MRNLDRLMQMPLEELAPYFVKDETKAFDDPCLTSPSGSRFWDEEDAIEDCIEWLESDVLSEDTQVYCTMCSHFWIDESETPQCEYCQECDLSDCEDSRPYRERPKYTELYRKRDSDD